MSEQAVPGQLHTLASRAAGKEQRSQDGAASVFVRDKKKTEGSKFTTTLQKEGEGKREKEKLQANQQTLLIICKA